MSVKANENSQLAIEICVCVLVTLFAACTKLTGTTTSPANPKNAASVPENNESKNNVSFASGKWSETILPSGESLRAVRFIDPLKGWVGSSSGSLYRTVDGGIRWNRVALGNQPGNYMVSLDFVGDRLGWTVFSKYPLEYSDFRAYDVRILSTEDGGESWTQQYERRQAAINKVRFNQQEGWAIGVTYDGNRTSYLVLHTTDNGKHWEDQSARFGRALNSVASYNFPIDLYVTQPSQATVLTVGGSVARTYDGGRVWRLMGTIREEFQQTGFMRIGVGNDEVWALGGADSKEGIWAIFSVLNKDNSWTNYRATQTFFRDAVFLPGSGAIACGAVPDYEDPQKVTDRRNAVISYSPDGGRNWSVVYQSSKAKVLNALFAVNDRDIWAVGDAGLIVHFEPSTRTN